MGNITLAPVRKTQGSNVQTKKTLKVAERKIASVINQGGSPSKYEQSSDADEIKQINIRLLTSEVNAIKELRERMPKSKRGGKRLAISLHDWIVEAVQEKIKRDFKKT
jgi:hypothetical protein